MDFPLSSIYFKPKRIPKLRKQGSLPWYPTEHTHNPLSHLKFIKFYFLHNSYFFFRGLQHYQIEEFFVFIKNKTVLKVLNNNGIKCFLCLNGIDSFIFFCGKNIDINYSGEILLPDVEYSKNEVLKNSVINFKPAVLYDIVRKEEHIIATARHEAMRKKYIYRKKVFMKSDIRFIFV